MPPRGGIIGAFSLSPVSKLPEPQEPGDATPGAGKANPFGFATPRSPSPAGAGICVLASGRRTPSRSARHVPCFMGRATRRDRRRMGREPVAPRASEPTRVDIMRRAIHSFALAGVLAIGGLTGL